MTKRSFRLAVILAVVFLMVGRTAAAGRSFSKVKVMATVFPLFEFATAVGGDLAEVDLLIPPGADVHSWQPRVSDIKKISGDLRLFLFIGPDLEPWAADLVKSVARPGLRILEASRGLDLIREEEPGEIHHGADPHVWLDFGQDLAILDRIATALAEIEPSGTAIFRSNAESYKAKLRALDQRYAEGLRECRGRRLLVGGHAAFGYLARRYGLVQTAVYSASPDAAATPRDMVRLVATAKSEGVKTVFYEPGVGDRLARVVAAEIGAEVRLLHPGHNLLPSGSSGPETFLDLMDRNLEILRHGLGCR
jgi:zinc transport system substrate-binding protein